MPMRFEDSGAVERERARVIAGAERLVLDVAGEILTQAQTASPKKTGTLRRSLSLQPIGPLRYRIGSRGVPYARIQDLGGRTRAHIIRPRNKQALAWPGGAHPVKVVHHPGSQIPGNRYLTAAWERGSKRLSAGLRALTRGGV